MVKEYDAKVKEIIKASPDTRIIRISFPEIRKFDFKPGQFIILWSDKLKEDNGVPVKRAYSLASLPSEKSYLELAIKIVAGGKFTEGIVKNLKAGDKLHFEGPFGNFVFQQTDKDIVFISAGCAIAPIVSMLHHMAEIKQKNNVTLLYGMRTMQDFVYSKELLEFKNKLKNFKLVLCVTREAVKEKPEGVLIENSRVTADVIKRHVNNILDTEYYFAGMPGMVLNITEILKTLRVPNNHIHSEKD